MLDLAHLTVEMRARATETINQLARHSRDGRETGGILLGHGPLPDGHITITAAGGPGPDAIRQARFFSRDTSYADALAEAAWRSDRAQWVGEWHTHPEGGRAPSPRDLAAYAQTLHDPELAFEVFVSIIVTPSSADAWEQTTLTTWTLARQVINTSPAPNIIAHALVLCEVQPVP